MTRLLAVLMFMLIAACDLEGCLAGRTYTLIYRSPVALDEGALVMREDQTIGVIRTVADHEHGQKVELRIRMHEPLYEGDRFVPLLREEEGTGLMVQSGGGDIVQVGATIYYPPLRAANRRSADSQSSNVSELMGDPADEIDYLPVSDEPPAGPSAYDGPLISHVEDTYTRRNIRWTMRSVGESANLPEPTRAQVEAMMQETRRPGRDTQVISTTRQHLPEIRESLSRNAREALQEGDREAAYRNVESLRRLQLLERRLDNMEQRARRNVTVQE